MLNMKNLIYFLLLIVISACAGKKCCTLVDSGLNISVKDSAGNDLLDPSFPDSFKKDSIRLFYLIKGEKVEVYNPEMDFPRNFNIFKGTSGYLITIFPNEDKSTQYPITYIDWNKSNEDTIECEVDRSSETEFITKVWFDGQLQLQGGTSREFSIIK